MYIIKRDGKKEEVHFDKITERIKKLINRPPILNIDPIIIAQKVVAGLYKGVTTTELDNLAAELAVSMCTIHPDYEQLASRIAISNLHKNTTDNYEELCDQLYNYKNNVTFEHYPLLSKECYMFIKDNCKVLQEHLNYENDYTYDYFGIKTLEKAYLIKMDEKIVERPQHLLMRVAVGIHQPNIENVIKTYTMLSNKLYILATPTLFNAGTNHPQLSSCFLLHMKEDSIDGIYDTLKQCALISKWAGGIGLNIHDIRAKDSYIKGTNGFSRGIVPMLQNFNYTARYVDQGGGKRKGSFAIYIEPHHADIEDFLELRNQHKKEELRCLDLFYALWVSDLFMKRVENDQSWSLFCPNEAPGLSDVFADKFVELYEKYENEGRARKVVKARDLWNQIVTSQIEHGLPYIMYKDIVNLHNNQSNLGTIKSSNLCVSGDTFILTDKGQIPIKQLVNKKINVWNGEEWSGVTVRQTGVNQELVKVTFSNGVELKCTPYHKFHVINTNTKRVKIVEANQLKLGDKLIKYNLPTINFEPEEVLKYPYTQGFFTGDGTYNRSSPILFLYHEKKKLLPYIEYLSYTENKEENRYNITLPKDLKPKSYIPFEQDIKTKVEWFSGYCDADGCIVKNGEAPGLQIACIHKDFLLNLKLMLQTIGVDSKVCKNKDARKEMLPDHKGGKKLYNCKTIYRILIGIHGLKQLQDLGFSPKRLVFNACPDRHNFSRYIQIVSVDKLEEREDTYCFNETKKNLGMFQGILLGNCSEIVEYTDKNEVAVCNLASVALPKCVVDNRFDFEKLYDITYHAINDLNKVIDVNFYPVPEAKNSNLKHRPVGCGVIGLADTFMMLRIPFDSEEAKLLNKDIFETMYYAATRASCDLAKLYQPYDSFIGSPASMGKLCPDLWDHLPSDRWDYETLRQDVMKYGLRNSLLLSVQPTASTSNILGYNECIEPFTSNIYVRRVLSGDFIMLNKYLINDLIELKLWDEKMKNLIIANKGSIQNINTIPSHIKALYKTVYEIPLKHQVDMNADRQRFVDQAISFNVFMDVPTKQKVTSYHFYAWKKGVKTSSYYLRTLPAVTAKQFTVNTEMLSDIVCNMEEGCVVCGN